MNSSNEEISKLHKELEDAEEEKREMKRVMASRQCVNTDSFDFNVIISPMFLLL